MACRSFSSAVRFSSLNGVRVSSTVCGLAGMPRATPPPPSLRRDYATPHSHPERPVDEKHRRWAAIDARNAGGVTQSVNDRDRGEKERSGRANGAGQALMDKVEARESGSESR